jgi:hypothetical protein
MNLNGTNADFSPVSNAVFAIDWSKSSDLFPQFEMLLLTNTLLLGQTARQ